MSHRRSLGVAESWDAAEGVLTILTRRVNTRWVNVRHKEVPPRPKAVGVWIGHLPSQALKGKYRRYLSSRLIVQYNQPGDDALYVNSSWKMLAELFKGDVINSYNDGPVGGGILGSFYEIETSSPALALAPGERSRKRWFQGFQAEPARAGRLICCQFSWQSEQ